MLEGKRRKIVLLGGAMLTLVLALTLAVSTALATHNWTPESITCNPRSHSVTVTGYLSEANGSSIGGYLYVDGVDEGWYQENPSGSPGIYSITITHPDIDYGTTVEVVDTENEAVETDCREKGEPVIPYTGIYLMSPAAQAPYLSVPNAAGDLPCGVFDVNGWGAKYVGLGDFPGCTPPVTVMCFNDAGAWTADTVSGVVMKGDYEVDFISHQHGICGLFPSS